MESRKVKIRLLQFTAISAGLSFAMVSQNISTNDIVALQSYSAEVLDRVPTSTNVQAAVSQGVVSAASLPLRLANRLGVDAAEFETASVSDLVLTRLDRSLELPMLPTVDWMSLAGLPETEAAATDQGPRVLSTAAGQTGAYRSDLPGFLRARTDAAGKTPAASSAERASGDDAGDEQVVLASLNAVMPPVRPRTEPEQAATGEDRLFSASLPWQRDAATEAHMADGSAAPAATASSGQCAADAVASGGVVTGDKISLRLFELSGGGALPADAAAATREFAFERLDLGGTYEVGEDGTLSLPLLGRVSVRGQDLACTEARVASRFSDALGTNVTVNAAFAARPPVIVKGAVRAPGAYQFTPGMTVEEVMALAGATAETTPQNEQLRAELAARRDELERLEAGKTLEKLRLLAAFSGEADIALSDAERALMERALGASRLESELMALRTSREAVAAQEADQRARASEYDAQIAALEDGLNLITEQVNDQTARLAELRALHDKGVVPLQRLETSELSLMPLARARLEMVTELVKLRSERNAILRAIDIATAERREQLAARIRDSAAELDSLLAQRGNVETQLAALESVVGDTQMMAFVIERPTPDGKGMVIADPSTRLMPGDVATIRMVDPSSPLLARAEGTPAPLGVALDDTKVSQ